MTKFLLLVATACCFAFAHGADSNGQKAHFQVEDKSGDLKIHATKELATVEAQADSVDVVIKPGTAEYPVFKSDKPIVHVASPVGMPSHHGWDVMSFKKSKITKTKHGRHKATTKGKTFKERHGKPRKVNLKVKHKKKHHKKRKLHHILKAKRVKEQAANKKSTGTDPGSKMLVTAKTGRLKVHTDKKITTVTSTTGALDFFAKNAPVKTAEGKKNDSSQKPKQNDEEEKLLNSPIHVINWKGFFAGLKRNLVLRLKERAKQAKN